MTAPARRLIATIGEYVEVPGARDCCGAAGTYALVRPGESRQVLANRLDAIEAAGIDILVVVNPGCQRQLIDGLRSRKSPTRVLHLTELLDMAAAHPVEARGRQRWPTTRPVASGISEASAASESGIRRPFFARRRKQTRPIIQR